MRSFKNGSRPFQNANARHRRCDRSVAEACETVLVPAIGARTRMLVREILPCLAVGAVVLAYRAPGAFANIRPNRFPVAGGIQRRVGEPCVLRRTRCFSPPDVVHTIRLSFGATMS